MHTVETLRYIIEQNQVLAYLAMTLITVVEGEVVTISAGILILLGALNFWIALIAIVIGGIGKSILGYFVGTMLNKKFDHNRFFQYIERKVLSVMPHFEEKPFWSIFVSKFLMVNHFVIIFCGYKKINFKEYMKAELASTLPWALSLLALGYFFSYAAFRISHRLTDFLLIIVLCIVGFFLVEKIVSLLYNAFESILHDHGNK